MGVDLHNVHYQMAKTVEDVLMRRTRAILLNARAATAAAPLVAQLMATELGKSSEWIADQIHQFNLVATSYHGRL